MREIKVEQEVESAQPQSDKENVLVIENEFSKTYEGNKLPDEIDLKKYIPELPPSSKRIGIIDNQRSDGRILNLKYEVTKEAREFKDLMLKGLEEKNWAEVTELSNGLITAKKDNDQISIDTREVDRLSLMVTVTLSLYN